jgi:hypothetical protein
MSETTNQPLFFKNPVPIQKERHAKAGLMQDSDFKFAKKTNSVPINMQEFSLAAKSYPIVFTGGAQNIPVAVLGLENDINAFVNKAGKWEKGHYIPAYVRQYPFAFMVEQEKLVLCVDESSSRFKKTATAKDLKFFDGVEQSDFTKNALDFCLGYYQDFQTTKEFVAALEEKGLLIERQINATKNGSKKPVSLSGFKVVDEEKLAKLDDKTIIDWYKKGYLALINFHMLSFSNWNNLTAKL